MNFFQTIIYNLFRRYLNPYFKKNPGAMMPILFSFENELKKAGFSAEEIQFYREDFNKKNTCL